MFFCVLTGVEYWVVRQLLCITAVCTARKISPSHIKFLIYVIIILRSIFCLVHVVQIAYYGGGCVYFKKEPSRPLNTVSGVRACACVRLK